MTEKVFLIADDDKDDIELFCEAIASLDKTIVCHCTENGLEALNKLAELTAKPHLIFLDVNMPVMNGWQCLKELKTHENYKHIPVIIYSTSSHQREKDVANDLGALCFFTKPDDFFELKSVLEVIVHNLGAELANALQNMHDGASKSIYVFTGRSKIQYGI